MATLDKAEQLEERLVISSSQQGVSATLRLTTETGKRLTRWSGTAVKKTGVGMAHTVAYGHQALSESLREMADGIRERAHEKEWGSKVPLEEFTETVDGKREVLELEDNELVEEVRQELRKHNVTFAVEHDDQDRYYLHVRGNDATLIAHALDRAQERLDTLRTRDEPTQDRDEPAQEQAQDTPDREGRQRTTPEKDSPREPYFTTTRFEGEGWASGTVEKSVALKILGAIPADEEIPGRGLTDDMLSPLKDVREWIGQDPDVDQAIAEKFPDLMTPEQLAVARSHDGPTPEQPKVPTPEEKALTAREEAELAQRRDWAEEMNAVEDRVQKPVLREQLAETSRDFGPADELDRETLPDGYESITEENARQRGPEPAPTGRERREQERPARGRSDDHRQPERSEGRGRGDAPRRTELDSREQSKATIRDKISAVADRLQRTAGRDAPTQVLGLDAHRKGPTR